MILVCVTEQIASKRLIEAGYKLAIKTEMPLKVICVRATSLNNWLASEEVEALFSLSKQLGAEMIVKFSEDAVDAVSNYIESQPIQAILAGIPPSDQPSSFISGLESRFPQIPLIQVDTTGQLRQNTALKKQKSRRNS